MSRRQELQDYDITIPDDKVKAFVDEIYRNKLKIDFVVDEPGAIRTIRLGEWILLFSMVHGIFNSNVRIIKYPLKPQSTDFFIMDLIAKYALDGGYIEMTGEKGLWRWMFKDGKAIKVDAIIFWPGISTEESLQQKYDELLDKQLKLYRELDDNRKDFQKIRNILKTRQCDAYCGTCRLFGEGGCLKPK